MRPRRLLASQGKFPPTGRDRWSKALEFLVVFPGCRGGETADAVDSKSTVGNHMRVQVPPSASKLSRQILAFYFRPGRLSSDRHARKPLTVSELWPFALKESQKYRLSQSRNRSCGFRVLCPVSSPSERLRNRYVSETKGGRDREYRFRFNTDSHSAPFFRA